MGARTPQDMAAAAKHHVDRAHFANNTIFAYYRLHPIKMRLHYRRDLKGQADWLERIAPWLPKRVPKWMRPQL